MPLSQRQARWLADNLATWCDHVGAERIAASPGRTLDLDSIMVTMDKAADGGLLSWPDIVDKMIHVHWTSVDGPWVGGPGYSTRVLAVGPLGILGEWDNGRFRERGLIPWDAAVITWRPDDDD